MRKGTDHPDDVAVAKILEKGLKGRGLTTDEALALLEGVPDKGALFDALIHAADGLTRKQFGNVGEIHGQIGLNWDRCSKDCQFCIFSETWGDANTPSELSEAEVLSRAENFAQAKAASISIMSTADYPFEKFLHMGSLVNKKLLGKIPLFANWGDLTYEEAKEVKKAGYTFYYHALRLGEGIITKIDPYKRMQTIENAHRAGLLVGSCLEPIGPEHTNEELVETMETMRRLKISWMATMKRISHQGSPLAPFGELTDESFARITAVTRLFFGHRIFTMAAHEPSDLCMKAGANFLVAEMGTNPRDNQKETACNRAWDVPACKAMLKKNGFNVFEGNLFKRYAHMALKNRAATHAPRILINRFFAP